jgi:hypothetical protein
MPIKNRSIGTISDVSAVLPAAAVPSMDMSSFTSGYLYISMLSFGSPTATIRTQITYEPSESAGGPADASCDWFDYNGTTNVPGVAGGGGPKDTYTTPPDNSAIVFPPARTDYGIGNISPSVARRMRWVSEGANYIPKSAVVGRRRIA